jgi:toxin FitB
MLILDTNVISEILRPEPAQKIKRWFEDQPRHQLYTTAITQAEVLYGISLLSKGARRQKLLQAATFIFREDFENHILPFDGDAAHYYAEIGAGRRQLGRPISQFDAMIAAIARLHGAAVVTRNTPDFDGCQIQVIDPWA